jgi:hypothetical protein
MVLKNTLVILFEIISVKLKYMLVSLFETSMHP